MTPPSPLPQAVDVLTHTLNHHHAGSNVDFTENELAVVSGRIRDMSTSGGGAPRVNVDHVIELVMCRWSTKMRDREVDLRKTFRAGDVDLNNVLSFGKWAGGGRGGVRQEEEEVGSDLFFDVVYSCSILVRFLFDSYSILVQFLFYICSILALFLLYSSR